MNQDVSCHVMHYRSAVDDTDQPIVFSMPSVPAGMGTIPCILLSHDVLEPATRDRFIDVALREAHRWLAALRDSAEPICLLQPMGRANAEAIGLGGRDLFDAIAAVQDDQRVTLGPVYGAGIGAGGTKTLQWACWFPHRFDAIAVAGAVVDERIDQCEERESAPWEASAKESLRPSSLLGNLAGMPIYVEHPWWCDGIGGRLRLGSMRNCYGFSMGRTFKLLLAEMCRFCWAGPIGRQIRRRSSHGFVPLGALSRSGRPSSRTALGVMAGVFV